MRIEDSELRELLHLVSHDIRNPLAAIVTNLEFARRLVTEDGVDQDLRESVEDSVVACEVLKRVVANFDVLAKGDDINITLTEVIVAATVRETVKRCGERAEQAGLSIDVDDGGVDAIARLDRQLFGLLLENLLSNSIQHGPRNSTVKVVVAQEGDHAIVSVTDAGKTIPAEHRERAVAVVSHTPKGRTGPTRYGRGLSLLTAKAASVLIGVALELDGDDGAFTMRLKIPISAD